MKNSENLKKLLAVVLSAALASTAVDILDPKDGYFRIEEDDKTQEFQYIIGAKGEFGKDVIKISSAQTYRLISFDSSKQLDDFLYDSNSLTITHDIKSGAVQICLVDSDMIYEPIQHSSLGKRFFICFMSPNRLQIIGDIGVHDEKQLNHVAGELQLFLNNGAFEFSHEPLVRLEGVQLSPDLK